MPGGVFHFQLLLITNMFLSIATTHRPATDLGYLLLKHPDRVHEIELPFGKAVVFYATAAIFYAVARALTFGLVKRLTTFTAEARPISVE